MNWLNFYSADPVADAERYNRHLDRMLERLPICEVCGDHIEDEKAFCFNGEWVHRDCLFEYFENDYKTVPYED